MKPMTSMRIKRNFLLVISIQHSLSLNSNTLQYIHISKNKYLEFLVTKLRFGPPRAV